MNNLFYCNKNCPPCPPKPPKPPAPQKKPPKKNIDFKKLKKNTCKSLNEVECFLNDFKRILKDESDIKGLFIFLFL